MKQNSKISPLKSRRHDDGNIPIFVTEITEKSSKIAGRHCLGMRQWKHRILFYRTIKVTHWGWKESKKFGWIIEIKVWSRPADTVWLRPSVCKNGHICMQLICVDLHFPPVKSETVWRKKKVWFLLIPFSLPLFVYACARSQAKNLSTWHRSMYHYTICTVGNSQILYELIITTIKYQPVVTMFLWHRRTQSATAKSRRRVFWRLTQLHHVNFRCKNIKVWII